MSMLRLLLWSLLSLAVHVIGDAGSASTDAVQSKPIGALHGTLIGVFVAGDKIRVMADSAMQGTGVRSSSVGVEKVCISGNSSVATMTGQIAVTPQGARSTDQFDARPILWAVCRRSAASDMAIEVQAAELGAGILEEASKHLSKLSVAEAQQQFPHGYVVEAIVAGRQNGRSWVEVVRVVPYVNAGALAFKTVKTISYNRKRPCDVTFLGSTDVVAAILNGDRRIPLSTKSAADRLVIQAGLNGDCSKVDLDAAGRFYQAAITATSQFGTMFGIPQSRVGWPIDVFRISAEGIVKARREQ